MGLKAITLAGVKRISGALGDLALNLTLVKRTKATYVPGSPQSYTSVNKSVKGVITKFRQEEVDGTQIQGIDMLIIMWPSADGVIPEPNDSVVHGSRILGRVMAVNPLYAGSEIAFTMVQVRPPV